MELRTLRYFLAAAQEENITRAADILHVTQPTLSRQMMDLERELGVTLMLRGKNGLTLTDDGIFSASGHRKSLSWRTVWKSPLQSGRTTSAHGCDRRVRGGGQSDAGKIDERIF